MIGCNLFQLLGRGRPHSTYEIALIPKAVLQSAYFWVVDKVLISDVLSAVSKDPQRQLYALLLFCGMDVALTAPAIWWERRQLHVGDTRGVSHLPWCAYMSFCFSGLVGAGPLGLFILFNSKLFNMNISSQNEIYPVAGLIGVVSGVLAILSLALFWRMSGCVTNSIQSISKCIRDCCSTLWNENPRSAIAALHPPPSQFDGEGFTAV